MNGIDSISRTGYLVVLALLSFLSFVLGLILGVNLILFVIGV